MKTILRHSVIILILSCLITVFVNRIMGMWIFKIAFPEQSALQSFEFEDFAFSTRQTNENRDENIVLVNIGQLDRSGIAEQISILSKFSPKAIAVNVHFNCGEYTDIHNCPQLLDSLANRQLQEAIVSAGNVILASKLVFKKSKEQNSNWHESLELADPNFSLHARNGFANLVTHESDKLGINSCRSFIPVYNHQNKDVYSFSIEVMKEFDSTKVQKFLSRKNYEEIINYQGNTSIVGSETLGYEYYLTLDLQDVLFEKFDPALIRDKIVILGYLGDYLEDSRSSEMFYSPLNRVVLGKSIPDMYGTVVQANIISMILSENYINRISNINGLIISLIIVFINAIFFSWFYPKESIWYEPLTILIPALQIIFLAYLRYLLFTHWNYILDLSLAAILLVSVSLSAGLYFGPLQKLQNRLIKN